MKSLFSTNRLAPEQMFFGDTKEFHISQPGSSVATSLCEAEAKEKRVGILEILGKRFKMKERPLMTVRPMIFRTICIEEEMNLADFRHLPDKKLTAKIDLFLKSYVEKLLEEETPKLLTGHPDQPVLPQVRVRVEYIDERHQVCLETDLN
jgi:double-strand break repair protein MRE11